MTEVDLIYFIEHSSSPGMIKIIQGHLLLILASKNEERCKPKLSQGHLEKHQHEAICVRKQAEAHTEFEVHVTWAQGGRPM